MLSGVKSVLCLCETVPRTKAREDRTRLEYCELVILVSEKRERSLRLVQYYQPRRLRMVPVGDGLGVITGLLAFRVLYCTIQSYSTSYSNIIFA